MVYKGTEIRECRRFKLLGTTVSYKQKKHFFFGKLSMEEECPVLDISRGGIRFVGNKYLRINVPVSLKIVFPVDNIQLFLRGRVRWISIYPGKSYEYQTGVQFQPFGEKRGLNNPSYLAKIIELEKRTLRDK